MFPQLILVYLFFYCSTLSRAVQNEKLGIRELIHNSIVKQGARGMETNVTDQTPKKFLLDKLIRSHSNAATNSLVASAPTAAPELSCVTNVLNGIPENINILLPKDAWNLEAEAVQQVLAFPQSILTNGLGIQLPSKVTTVLTSASNEVSNLILNNKNVQQLMTQVSQTAGAQFSAGLFDTFSKQDFPDCVFDFQPPSGEQFAMFYVSVPAFALGSQDPDCITSLERAAICFAVSLCPGATFGASITRLVCFVALKTYVV